MPYNKRMQKLSLTLIVLCILTIQCNENRSNASISVSIKAINGLKYDKIRFSVKPGSKVLLTLNNESDMPHNMVITKPGARQEVVSAGLKLEGKGPEMNFIPDIDAVLWSIPILSPGQSKSVSFTAPSKTGVYPYVCTYPGHGFTMFGEMHVTMNADTAQITENDSLSRKTKIVEKAHPYPLTTPYLYHVFIEGASPASIGVALPNQLSYCWDATSCRILFAWKGEFLDMADMWEGHFDAYAKVLGDIFFTDNTDYPLRITENAIPEVKYKGYRLVEHYPEFHYQLNGMDVYELNKPKSDSMGLIREFRIPNAKKPISYYVNSGDNAMKYEFSAGRFDKRKLRLSPADAKKFTITMTSYHLAYKYNRK